MNLIRSIKKITIVAGIALAFSNASIAQEAAQVPEKVTAPGYNQLAILLIATSVLLVFVIWGMGQTLLSLGKLLLEKKKNSTKLLTALFLLGFSLLSHTSLAQDPMPAVSVKTIPNYGGLSENTFYLMTTVIAIEVTAILFIAFFIQRLLAELLPEKETAAKISTLKTIWASLDKKLFTRAVPVAKEADVLLDHDYDGIKELDNALPPWWKYGFYITIAVAFVYLLHFHFGGTGKNPTQEYEAEMEKARVEKEIYESKNKDKVDENNVPMADATGLEKAKGFFLTDCWACHGKLGEGGAGPNLTDDYWLHKGSLNDVFQSIKHGYPDKGMQAWSVKYNPKEISLLASYIKSLHGTNPPGAKTPQGDLFTDSTTNSLADSSKEKPITTAELQKTK